jgi:hypothetical protein
MLLAQFAVEVTVEQQTKHSQHPVITRSKRVCSYHTSWLGQTGQFWAPYLSLVPRCICQPFSIGQRAIHVNITNWCLLPWEALMHAISNAAWRLEIWAFKMHISMADYCC